MADYTQNTKANLPHIKFQLSSLKSLDNQMVNLDLR